MKSTNATGFDGLSSKTIKEIPHITSLWITHLINSMLRTGIFPKILKIQKITPIKKPQKNSNMMTSYRPICNLQVYEKVIEEVLKRRMMTYFEENAIILEEHHGGRKGHSTISAKAVLEDEAHRNLDKNKFGLIISTDLTGAYDCVDHEILKEKMKYYGLKGKLMDLMESYLDEREQYVEIHTKKSKRTKCLKCSVIQGSRMSGMLYTIYTNEVVKLHELLNDSNWMEENLKKKAEKYKEVEHTVVQFVDDSNSMISFKHH